MIDRNLIARASLPALALAASYGVYSFQRVFVPEWVALVSAAAFELVWLGLAAAATTDHRRARVIALAAVVVSAIYNALAAALHLRPDLVAASPSLAATALLAMLHGAPLAILGYAVADLLLHQAQPEAHPPATITVNSEQTIVAVSDPIARVVAGELTQAQAAAQLGVSRQAIGKRIKKMEATS